jgi:hypothetical protein
MHAFSVLREHYDQAEMTVSHARIWKIVNRYLREQADAFAPVPIDDWAINYFSRPLRLHDHTGETATWQAAGENRHA